MWIASLLMAWVSGMLSLRKLHSHSFDLFTFGFLLSILSPVGKQIAAHVSSVPVPSSPSEDHS